MALTLEQHTAKYMTMKFLGLAVDEWDKMYHNASMHHCRKWPEYDGEKEGKIFWEYFMQDIAGFGREDLENDIKEQFEFHWAIGFYGRNGATAAPIDIVDHARNGRRYGEYGRNLEADDLMSFLDGVNYWGNFNDIDDIDDELDEDIDWLAAYHTTKNCLEAFKHINQYCRSTMECLAESWEEFKENYPDMFESDDDDDEDDISAAA